MHELARMSRTGHLRRLQRGFLPTVVAGMPGGDPTLHERAAEGSQTEEHHKNCKAPSRSWQDHSTYSPTRGTATEVFGGEDGTDSKAAKQASKQASKSWISIPRGAESCLLPVHCWTRGRSLTCAGVGPGAGVNVAPI